MTKEAADYTALHKHILYKIELALGGRSWKWLATKSRISQSTLQTQKMGPGGPRFTLETLYEIAPVLKKPVTWFLPEQEVAAEELAGAESFRQVAELVDWLRQGE